jgi:hypothetical protein
MNEIDSLHDISEIEELLKTLVKPSWPPIGNYAIGAKYESLELPEGYEKPSREAFEAGLQKIVERKPYKNLRMERNKLLQQSDFAVAPDYKHATHADLEAWMSYRQSLRDLPDTAEDPVRYVLPKKPVPSSGGSPRSYVEADNVFARRGVSQLSDDRLKTNEEHLLTGKATILKLKPQVYDKVDALNADAADAFHESGLIAQDVYYDAPELKHLLILPPDARPPVFKPVPSGDIQEDPDYSSWGGEPTRLNYIGLIPYLVRSTQELNAELVAERVKVATLENRVRTKGRRLAIPYDEVDEKSGLLVTVAGELSNVSRDVGFLGVVEKTQPDEKTGETLVTTTGETRVWVTDEGVSEIRVGDLVVTSNVPGYAMVQDDDLLRAHTVGRVLEFCDFTPENVHVQKVLTERANVTTYHALVEVHFGEYSNLASEDRLAVGEVYYLRTTQQQVAVGEPHDLAKWFKTQSITVDAGTYAALPEDERVNYELDDATGQYVYTQEITVTQEVYNDLSASEKSTYAYGYFRYVYDESPVPKPRYEERSRERYYRILATSPVALPNYHEHTREEDVPVLDAHGQYQYVDTDEVEPAYQTRYILADGSLTTRHNMTHNAALLRVQLLA